MIKIIITHFFCRKRSKTITAVKVLSTLNRICPKDEHCDMKFLEKSFIYEKNFQIISAFLKVYCGAGFISEHYSKKRCKK